MNSIYLALFCCLVLLGCKETKHENDAVQITADATHPEASPGHEFDSSIDSLPAGEKREKMLSASIAEDEIRDTYCPQCGSRCCIGCTAGGNPSSCSQTMFRECSKCGHPSAAHYGVKQ